MANSSAEVLPLSAATKIADYHIAPEGKPHSKIEITQAEHRIRLVNAWAPALGPGSRVLELGCGQGTCTAVLAEAAGETGHVDAVDPGAPDYGAPYTLAQAQGHLSQGAIGSRISWHRADPVDFLKEQGDKTWDVAVLAHCIWYFKSPEALAEILAALKGRVSKILVAEHAMQATEKAAIPHLLSTLARATLEAHRGNSNENIQNPLSPAGIKEIAVQEGWTVKGESIVVPEQGLSDGFWETGTVKSEKFLVTIEQAVSDSRVKLLLRSARDAVLSSIAAIGELKNVRTMDTWVATLEVV